MNKNLSKLIGGQLLYYGENSLIKAAEFWKSIGAKIVMLKPHKYEDFFDQNNKINKKYLLEIEKIRSIGMQILIHIEHWKKNGQMVEPTDINQHTLLEKILTSLIWLIKKYDLWPEICLGGPAILYPLYKFSQENKIDKRLGMISAVKFFTIFSHVLRRNKINLSLENMPIPQLCYRNNGEHFEKICYKPEHFKRLINQNHDVYSICLDIGHMILSNSGIQNYLELPYRFTTLHLHSNKGKKDDHILLTFKNAPEGIIDLLKRSSGPWILELKNKEQIDEIKQTILLLKKYKLINL